MSLGLHPQTQVRSRQSSASLDHSSRFFCTGMRWAVSTGLIKGWCKTACFIPCIALPLVFSGAPLVFNVYCRQKCTCCSKPSAAFDKAVRGVPDAQSKHIPVKSVEVSDDYNGKGYELLGLFFAVADGHYCRYSAERAWGLGESPTSPRRQQQAET